LKGQKRNSPPRSPRETLSNNPIPAIETTIDDPPKLINGNAMPVNGSNPVITPTLIKA
jgi:hypothetical protein